MKKNSRRKFIKKSTVLGSGIFIVPRSVLGGNGYTSPSDQLLIAQLVQEEKEVTLEMSGQVKKELLLFVMYTPQEIMELQNLEKHIQMQTFMLILENYLIKKKI